MAMSNQELLNKAVLTADQLASGGKLQPDEADKFIDFVFDQSQLRDTARTVRVNGDQWQVNKLNIGKRQMKPAETATDPGVRRGVSTSQVKLKTHDVITSFDISDEFAEENIEGESIRERIVRMMAKGAANDIEEFLILGSGSAPSGGTSGPAVIEDEILDGGSSSKYVRDDLLGMDDGLLEHAESGNAFDAGGSNISPNIFGNMIRAMPRKFRRNRDRLRFMGDPDTFQRWRERLTSRGTAMGDNAMTGGDVNPFGVRRVEFPLWPEKPTAVEHLDLPDGSFVNLRHAPVSNVVVTPNDLDDTPTSAFTAGTDYEVDNSGGRIKNLAGGAISNNQNVKITYDANPQMLLTDRDNLIVGVSRDVRIERARNIHRRVWEYVITLKLGFAVEEPNALVKASNIGTGV